MTASAVPRAAWASSARTTNDGWLDSTRTSFQLQHAILYRNLGRGQFEDVSFATGAGTGTYAQVTWGAGLVDFDNDGHRDLFVACGHLHDRVEEFDQTTPTWPGTFCSATTAPGIRHITDQAGDGLQIRLSSAAPPRRPGQRWRRGRRGAAIPGREPSLLRTTRAPRTTGCRSSLVGVKSNRGASGPGPCGGRGPRAGRRVHSGRGYQSHYGSRLQLRARPHRRVERIEVRWIGGGRRSSPTSRRISG